jgi:parafibromin
MDETAIQMTLQKWAGSQHLSSVQLSDDGASLSLGEATVPASLLLTISHADKTCRYTAASIYLQLLDPNQGLLVYRNACKKYGVADPIKALDKPVVLGFFLGISTGLASETVLGAPAPAAAIVPTARAESVVAPPIERPSEADKAARDLRHQQKKDRQKAKIRQKEHSSSSKRKGEIKNDPKAKKVIKKTPKGLVTDEQMFDNLNVVVDKRQVAIDHKRQQEITLALSASGFQVTPEMLEVHKERARTIMAREIPVGNSASILRAVNPRKDLSRVLELFNESIMPPSSKSSSKPGTAGSNNSRQKPGSSSPTKASMREHLLGKKPIIIVPKGMTAIITLANAHEFLCNARFVPRDVLVQQGRHRSPPTTFTRTVRGASGTTTTGLLEYEIIDNPRKLAKSAEWDRVVAVIALGKAWQFTDWLGPLYNSPATLFDKVYGYYVGMEGDKIPPEVKGWAVKYAKLARDKRGLDQIANTLFWSGLDEWMRVHKPELLPQGEM